MKRILLALVMVFSLFNLFGQDNTLKTVGVDEFEEFIADTNAILLDVRTAAEHAEGFIPGTDYNIDVLEDTFTNIATETLPNDRPVALYCRSGRRSKSAADQAVKLGFKVVELDGGIISWKGEIER